MKIVDTTIFSPPLIGKTKEKWLFWCDYCLYPAIFILYEGSGMSTGCERCLRGNMERVRKVEEEMNMEDWWRYFTTEDGIVMAIWYPYTIDDIFWWQINNLR